MFNLSKKTATKYHRFDYHPRNYDQKKEDFSKKKKIIKNRLENDDFDPLEYHLKNRTKNQPRIDLIAIAAIFFGIILFFSKVKLYFNSITRHDSLATYLLLISLGFIFIKRSKKKNV